MKTEPESDPSQQRPGVASGKSLIERIALAGPRTPAELAAVDGMRVARQIAGTLAGA